MRARERLGSNGVHDRIHKVSEQRAQAVEGEVHRASVGSRIPTEEGASDDGRDTHAPSASKPSANEKRCRDRTNDTDGRNDNVVPICGIQGSIRWESLRQVSRQEIEEQRICDACEKRYQSA